eukprot:gb/GECH01013748.1/.p1 GENE.gb/GECH01013748.1/~~gb/GECH01013748.1/.p1  ORF type:complete len:364 (+),score=104.18 gb/GECH01013748.1/:1-1092(+)
MGEKKKDKENQENEVKDEYDVDTVSAATRLLKKRKEILEEQSILDEKREEYKEKMEKIKEKENRLQKKRTELTNNLVTLEKFIKENEIKKTRSETKTREEEKVRKKTQNEVAQKTSKIKKLENDNENLKRSLHEKYLQYYYFLQKVMSARGIQDDAPEDVTPIINRYQTLYANNKELEERMKELGDQCDTQMNQINKYKEKMTSKLFYHNYNLGVLQRKLDETREATAKVQRQQDSQIKASADVFATLNSIKMACENMYEQCIKSSEIQRAPQNLNYEDSEELIMAQLNVIGHCLSDFMYISSEAKKSGVVGRKKTSQNHKRKRTKKSAPKSRTPVATPQGNKPEATNGGIEERSIGSQFSLE